MYKWIIRKSVSDLFDGFLNNLATNIVLIAVWILAFWGVFTARLHNILPLWVVGIFIGFFCFFLWSAYNSRRLCKGTVKLRPMLITSVILGLILTFIYFAMYFYVIASGPGMTGGLLRGVMLAGGLLISFTFQLFWAVWNRRSGKFSSAFTYTWKVAGAYPIEHLVLAIINLLIFVVSFITLQVFPGILAILIIQENTLAFLAAKLEEKDRGGSSTANDMAKTLWPELQTKGFSFKLLK